MREQQRVQELDLSLPYRASPDFQRIQLTHVS